MKPAEVVVAQRGVMVDEDVRLVRVGVRVRVGLGLGLGSGLGFGFGFGLGLGLGSWWMKMCACLSVRKLRLRHRRAGHRDLATDRRSRAEVAAEAEASAPPAPSAPFALMRPTPTLCRLRRSSSPTHPSATHAVQGEARLKRVSSRPAWMALGRCGVLAVLAREVWLVRGSSALWRTADECRVRVNPVEGQCVAA